MPSSTELARREVRAFGLQGASGVEQPEDRLRDYSPPVIRA
jgi:hypothetical protein